MKLTLLGSGTILPHTKRNPAGFCLQIQDTIIVFDLGAGNLHQLGRLGIYAYQIDALYFSHYHMDHIGDLPSLLFSLKIPGFKRKKPLHIYGPPGLKKLYKGLQDLWGGWMSDGSYPLKLHEIKAGNKVKRPDYELNAFEADHGGPNMDALCYRVEDSSGAVFVYSGDSDYCETLVACCQDADLAILECASTDKNKIPSHLTPGLCGKIAKKAGVQKVILTHLYPDCFLPQSIPSDYSENHSTPSEPYPKEEVFTSFEKEAGYLPIIGSDLQQFEILPSEKPKKTEKKASTKKKTVKKKVTKKTTKKKAVAKKTTKKKAATKKASTKKKTVKKKVTKKTTKKKASKKKAG